LIAFDGTLFQVLQLPLKPPVLKASKPKELFAVENLAKQIFTEV
jgi:hypothetical protein